MDSLKNTPAEAMTILLKAVTDTLPSLDPLLPKTAKVHAEFTFEGSEKYEVASSLRAGDSYVGMVAVSVSEGFSALYGSKSINKVSLDVGFVSVNIPL